MIHLLFIQDFLSLRPFMASLSAQALGGLESDWEKELCNPLPSLPLHLARQQETSGRRTESSERTHPHLGWVQQCLAPTAHLESGHPTVIPPNPAQVLHSYRDFADFWEERVGAFCCRVLAVLCKVCNFLSLSGVKGVIFLSTFRSWQDETVFFRGSYILYLQVVRCFFLTNFHISSAVSL